MVKSKNFLSDISLWNSSDRPLSLPREPMRGVAQLVGSDLVVSGCPSCKSNLQVAAAKLRKEGKAKIKVMDITELVVESLTEE